MQFCIWFCWLHWQSHAGAVLPHRQTKMEPDNGWQEAYTNHAKDRSAQEKCASFEQASRKKRASFRSKLDPVVHAALSKTQACTWIYNVQIGKKRQTYFLIRKRADKQTHISIHTIGIGSYAKTRSTKTGHENMRNQKLTQDCGRARYAQGLPKAGPKATNNPYTYIYMYMIISFTCILYI